MNIKYYTKMNDIFSAVEMTFEEYNKITALPCDNLLDPKTAGYMINQSQWIPKNIFDITYKEVYITDFKWAVSELEKGYKLTRSIWNKMYLYIDTKMDKKLFMVVSNAANSDNCCAWIPTVEDVLANDWIIYK